MRHSLILLFSLLIATCAPTTETKAKGRCKGYSTKKRKIIRVRINQRMISINKEKGIVTYNPDRYRRTATFRKYIFSLRNFRNKVGTLRSGQSVIAVIRVTKKIKKHRPYNPNSRSAQPYGGFRYYTTWGKIIRVIR